MQQHGTKHSARRHPDPGDGANRSKGNQKMQQQGSKYLPGDAYPLAPTMGMGSEGQNSTFFRTWSCCISKLKRITNAATW